MSIIINRRYRLPEISVGCCCCCCRTASRSILRLPRIDKHGNARQKLWRNCFPDAKYIRKLTAEFEMLIERLTSCKYLQRMMDSDVQYDLKFTRFGNLSRMNAMIITMIILILLSRLHAFSASDDCSIDIDVILFFDL